MSQVHVVLNLYERRDFSEKNVHTGVITELTVFLYKNCDYHKKRHGDFFYTNAPNLRVYCHLGGLQSKSSQGMLRNKLETKNNGISFEKKNITILLFLMIKFFE